VQIYGATERSSCRLRRSRLHVVEPFTDRRDGFFSIGSGRRLDQFLVGPGILDHDLISDNHQEILLVTRCSPN